MDCIGLSFLRLYLKGGIPWNLFFSGMWKYLKGGIFIPKKWNHFFFPWNSNFFRLKCKFARKPPVGKIDFLRSTSYFVFLKAHIFWVWQPDRTGYRLFPSLFFGVTVAPRCKLHKSVIFHFEEEGKVFQVNI